MSWWRTFITSWASSPFCAAGTRPGPKICDSGNNFPTTFGTSTIELTIQPTEATRFVWIEVVIPDNDEDNQQFSDRGTSGLLGYRVLRP